MGDEQERSQVTARLRKVLPPDPRWPCICHDDPLQEIAVSRFDDGDVRYCFACLQQGYACRLTEKVS